MDEAGSAVVKRATVGIVEVDLNEEGLGVAWLDNIFELGILMKLDWEK